MLEDVSEGNLEAAGVDLSVVSPVFGCEGTLELLVDEIAKAAAAAGLSCEVILVDDASPDGAWTTIAELAKTRPWLAGLRLSRNFGQHAAIYAGLCRTRGEWIVVMDCDMQDPPAALPDLHRTALADGVDIVFAQRMNRKDKASKRLGSWAFYQVLQWLTGVRQDESIANFGIYHRRVISAVTAMPERERAFPLMVKWTGFSQSVMPVDHGHRTEGASGYTFRKLLRLATSIALSYSDKPLRMVAGGGVICALIAFMLVGVSIVSFLAGKTTVAGFTTVIASVWLIGGLTLFALGVVGLYVGEVFRNVQGRPTAIIAESTYEPNSLTMNSMPSSERSSDDEKPART